MEEEKIIEPHTNHEEEESEEAKKKQVSFPIHLWGSLDSIKDNTKKGANILDGVINFTK